MLKKGQYYQNKNEIITRISITMKEKRIKMNQT